MRRRLATAAAALLLLATGCTDDAADAPASPAAAPALASLPELDPAWTADLGAPVEALEADIGATGSRGALTTWDTQDGLVLVGRTQLTAIADDGSVSWTFAVPAELGPVCRVTAPNAAGLAGVLFGESQECSTLGLFDVGTHQLRWTRDLGEAYGDIGDDVTTEDANLFVGTERVLVPTFCDGVLAFATATGEPLASDLASDREDGCVVDMKVSGGTGILVRSAGGGDDVLSRRDLETGEVLWERPVERTRLYRVVSLDPLVLDVETQGARLLQAYDETGQPGPYLGFDASTPPLLQGVADGVAAVSYDLTSPLDPGATYRGFDVETGEQVWRAPVEDAFVLGRTGDDLLLAGDVAASAGSDPGTEEVPALVLGRAGFDDPLDQSGIGTVRIEGQRGVDYDMGWTDDWFLVLRGAELTAYDLSADAGTPLPQAPVEEPAYAAGDVTAEQALDVCQEVSPETLAGLGIERGDLPPPATCSFAARGGDSGYRNLIVEVFPLAPADGESGVERAEKTLTEFLRRDRTDNPDYSAQEPVEGVGDEAQVSTATDDSQQQARLMARWHNVVLVVTAISDDLGDPGDSPGDGPSLDALRAGVGQVVVELVTELEDRAP